MNVFACTRVCVPCVLAVICGSQKRASDAWNWSYRWLETPEWLPGLEPESLGRIVKSLAAERSLQPPENCFLINPSFASDSKRKKRKTRQRPMGHEHPRPPIVHFQSQETDLIQINCCRLTTLPGHHELQYVHTGVWVGRDFISRTHLYSQSCHSQSRCRTALPPKLTSPSSPSHSQSWNLLVTLHLCSTSFENLFTLF